MRGLHETIAGLARFRSPLGAPSPGGGDVGMVPIADFGDNPGELRMLAHLPGGLPANAPLVVVLHGCTQQAGAHARAAGWLTLADRFGFAVLAPEQAVQNNPNRCFNWFEPGDIARGSGEAASIHAMIQHMVRVHGLDARRVFITGLSAGGAMAAVLLATYPETFAAGAVVSGLPFGVAANVQEALAAMHRGVHQDGAELAALLRQAAPAPRRRPRLAIWHGEADFTVVSGNAEALARQWALALRLSELPDEVLGRPPGWTRSVWRAPDGEALIELNLLAGLGHGAPVAASGDEPIGEAAPFMLEAGVSSSLEIARFWDLAPTESAADSAAWSVPAPAEPAGAAKGGLAQTVMDAVSPHVPDSVRKVIARALDAAGLNR